VPQGRGHGKVVKARSTQKGGSFAAALSEFLSLSFRGYAKHRTRKFEIPGLVLTHHPGMTTESANQTLPNSSST
jgi:hypothetical protein